jgi:hypothetical protein
VTTDWLILLLQINPCKYVRNYSNLLFLNYELDYPYAILEVRTAVLLDIEVFWDVTPCCLADIY